MKVRQLLEVLQNEVKKDVNFGEKEVTCYNSVTLKCHTTPDIPTFVDLSDEKYLDIVFN